MLTGENGLLTKAGQARESQTKAEEKEKIDLEVLASLGTDGELDLDTLKSNIASHIKEATHDNASSFPLTVTYTKTGNVYTVESSGKVKEASEETGSIKIDIFKIEGTPLKNDSSISSLPAVTSGTKATAKSKYTDSKGDVAIVPEGFTVSSTSSENVISKGLVVRDDAENEFVWVPVDRNQTIKIKVSSDEEIASIVLTNPVGEEKTVGNESGKEYAVDPSSFTKAYNGQYSLSAKTTSGETVEKTLIVRSLYAMDVYNDWYSTDEAIAILTQSSGMDETQLLQAVRASNKSEFGTKYAQMMASQFSEPTDTIDYEARVVANGGFYVGRYEAGKENDGLVIKANKDVWNNIPQTHESNTNALGVAKGYNTGINSSLLTGAAWDRTLGWLYETGDKTLKEITGDSTSWGNYKDEDDTNNPAKTGATSKAISNNIYDLAGNVWEWTTEAYITTYRVFRRRQLRLRWLYRSCF